ncbi:MAG TPA: hypothetical protein VFP87_12215 [Chitinophagaceae bacterium]|nr:hypothetical protein [Chitinophagaceae bacterium]
MSINQSTILKIARRSTVVFLLAASAISAFAILGDKGKTPKANRSFLSNESFALASASFSLKSHYNFRGSQIINPAPVAEYIDLNTVITYQKGNTTYVVPLKRKIFITTGNAGFSIHH